MSLRAILVAGLASALALVYATLLFFTHYPRKETAAESRYSTNDNMGPVHELPPRLRPAPEGAKADLELSVVVPSFNETQRLPKMLEEAVEYLEAHHHGQYEILIVDDASTDKTAEFAVAEAARLALAPHVLKVLQLDANRGKGGAVTHGILHGRGKYLLFADADGATRFGDVRRLVEAMDRHRGSAAIAIGSRAHMVNTDAVVKRSFVRNLLMYGLHALVYVFGIRDIQDTQCGFKMFNRDSVRRIFPHMHTERWIFDVEILLLAELQRIPIEEVPVNWTEVGGSKVDLARDSIQMAIDLVVTRTAYVLGLYKLNECGHS